MKCYNTFELLREAESLCLGSITIDKCSSSSSVLPLLPMAAYKHKQLLNMCSYTHVQHTCMHIIIALPSNQSCKLLATRVVLMITGCRLTTEGDHMTTKQLKDSYTHIHRYTCMHTCTHACTRTHTHAHAHAHAHARTHARTHTHTHTH